MEHEVNEMIKTNLHTTWKERKRSNVWIKSVKVHKNSIK